MEGIRLGMIKNKYTVCRIIGLVYNGLIVLCRPRPVYIGVHDLEGKPPTVW